jgi:uncharacterized protein (TIGR02757 family)
VRINGELRELLEQKANQFNSPAFIPDDPISVPHRFSRKEDIEIAALLSATISWGNRKSIVKSANRLLNLMDESPYEFVMEAQENELERLSSFVHRTFQGEDARFFVLGLRQIYRQSGGLEGLFTSGFANHGHAFGAIAEFRKAMLRTIHNQRTRKHLPDTDRGSAAKRLNMFLRWMVRQDNRGVDFGLWTGISPGLLSLPLDVHTGRVTRQLGLLNRQQDDRRAVEELDHSLRQIDPIDPVRFDFALFGLGLEFKAG